MATIINIEKIPSMKKKKNWYNPKTNSYISEREYNRLAQRARRSSISITEYLKKMGLIKKWGN